MPSSFTNITEINGTFTAVELDAGVDFMATNDGEVITVTGTGYGDGGFGDGGYGGDVTIIIGIPITIWTNVETP